MCVKHNADSSATALSKTSLHYGMKDYNENSTNALNMNLMSRSCFIPESKEGKLEILLKKTTSIVRTIIIFVNGGI